MGGKYEEGSLLDCTFRGAGAGGSSGAGTVGCAGAGPHPSDGADADPDGRARDAQLDSHVGSAWPNGRARATKPDGLATANRHPAFIRANRRAYNVGGHGPSSDDQPRRRDNSALVSHRRGSDGDERADGRVTFSLLGPDGRFPLPDGLVAALFHGCGRRAGRVSAVLQRGRVVVHRAGPGVAGCQEEAWVERDCLGRVFS